MDYMVTIVGLIAAVATTGSLLPQLAKLLKTKSTKDISLVMYSVFSVGVFLWVIYGVLLNDFPIIIANLLAFLQGLIIVAVKLKYK